MGYFSAGPGTAITIYDDNDATGGHVAGTYHTPDELFAYDPTVWTRLQSPAGVQFSATRFQYLLQLANTTIGSPVAGNINLTTLELKRCDIYVPAGRLVFTAANSALYQQLFMGTKIGTGAKTAGKDGASIHMGSQINFRCTLAMYDSYLTSLGTGQVLFNNSGSTYQEIGGCTLSYNGLGGLGTAAFGPLTIYNTTMSSRTVGSDMSGSCILSDSDNLLMACDAPRSFISTASPSTAVTKITFNGTPTQGDVRTIGFGWKLNNVTWSDNAPRVYFLGDVALANAHLEYMSFDVKVVDHLGNSLQAIPIQMWSDIEPYPGFLQTQTGFDGNIVYTSPNTSLANPVLVRRHYSTSSPTDMVEDRVFTLLVNGYDGLFPPNPNYITRLIVFEWPGRDRLGTSGYVTDGGTFANVKMPINLRPGSPSRDPLWTECQIT